MNYRQDGSVVVEEMDMRYVWVGENVSGLVYSDIYTPHHPFNIFTPIYNTFSWLIIVNVIESLIWEKYELLPDNPGRKKIFYMGIFRNSPKALTSISLFLTSFFYFSNTINFFFLYFFMCFFFFCLATPTVYAKKK